jgi:predicted anti-sigma-YlaC factor YlaD
MSHNHSSELCGELRAQLPDYLDGEAQETICRAIEEHLAGCDDCRVIVDTLKKTITLYHCAPRDDVPIDVHDRLVRVLNLDDIINRSTSQNTP